MSSSLSPLQPSKYILKTAEFSPPPKKKRLDFSTGIEGLGFLVERA